MEKIFDAVATHMGVDRAFLRFSFDGRKIAGGKF